MGKAPKTCNNISMGHRVLAKTLNLFAGSRWAVCQQVIKTGDAGLLGSQVSQCS